MASSVSQSIRRVWHQVHTPESLPFPSTVAALSALGVSRYTIDYAVGTATSYLPNNTVDVAEIPKPEGLEDPVPVWDKLMVQEAIRDVQAGKLSYEQFARKMVRAGVVGYMCFIEGKKVVYVSGTGDLHAELFPGALPE